MIAGASLPPLERRLLLAISRGRRRHRALFHACASIDQLEPRRLLASVGIVGGVLTVNADSMNDVINVAPTVDGKVRITLNGSSSDHSPAAFTGILVNANAGNDQVTIANALAKPATLKGGAGNDSLVGGGGKDVIDGGAGGDTIRGQGGSDTVDYSARTAPLVVGLGTLADDGEAGENDNVATDIETVLGGSGGDFLRGAAGNNRLVGNGGNDTIEGGAGGDRIKGGAGNDTVDYSARTAPLVIGLGTLSDDGEAGENDNVSTDIETVRGGSGNDFINGSAAKNLLLGNDGNDTLNGLGGDDALDGGAGDDTLDGAAGNDLLVGGSSAGGNDSLIGGTGNDTADYSQRTADLTMQGDYDRDFEEIIFYLLGQVGEADHLDGDVETVIGGSGNDWFNTIDNQGITIQPLFRWEGRGGNDRLVLGRAARGDRATLIGGEGNDSISSEAFINAVMLGGNGDDALSPGFGSDDLSGGPGLDSLYFNRFAGHVEVTLDDVADDLLRSRFDGDVIGNAHSDFESLQGTMGNDLLVAGPAGTVLYGLIGSDTLIGGSGNDTILGSAGSQTIRGGGGDDVISGEGAGDEGSVGPAGDALFGDDGDDFFTNRSLPGDDVDNPDAIDNDTIDGGAGFDFYQEDELDAFSGVEFNYDPLIAAPAPQPLDTDAPASPTFAPASGELNQTTVVVAEVVAAAAPPAPTLVAGTLTVNGTGDPDLIQVTQNPTLNSISVTINGTGFKFTASAVTLIVVSGGLGNDQIILRNSTGSQPVTKSTVLNGNGGHDKITGGSGNDTFVCNALPDGADEMIGGPGNDKVSYERRTGRVNILLDTLANDGALGEGDKVTADIEYCFGGAGTDSISGAARDDIFHGGSGADTLVGNDGADYLVGGNGSDFINGGGGFDSFVLTDGEADVYRLGLPGTEKPQRDFRNGVAIDLPG